MRGLKAHGTECLSNLYGDAVGSGVVIERIELVVGDVSGPVGSNPNCTLDPLCLLEF